MLLPALARAKLKATQANCLNNERQLALAFNMYVSDNNDRLLQVTAPSGFKSGGGYWLLDSGAPGSWGGSQATALQALKGCFKTNSLLAPYIGNSDANHCPGDTRFNNPIGSGNTTSWAYDSYAVTDNVTSNNNGSYYVKLTGIRRVADCMIFVEQADSRGYNNGAFDADSPGVTQLPFRMKTSLEPTTGTWALLRSQTDTRRVTNGSIKTSSRSESLPTAPTRSLMLIDRGTMHWAERLPSREQSMRDG